MGRISIIPTLQYEINRGPRGRRTVTHFDAASWECELFKAKSLWANGTYLESASGITEPEIRIMFETDQGELLFFHYIARVDLQKQATGEVSGPLSTGTVETDAERLLWLNETAIVGDGLFTVEDQGMSMVYKVYALERIGEW